MTDGGVTQGIAPGVDAGVEIGVEVGVDVVAPPAGAPLVQVRVVEIVAETAEACSIVVEPPPDAAAKFTYKPGQFLTLRLPCESGAVARCYSLCSSPHVDEGMRIAVKRVASGVGSNWIHDTLAVGDLLDCLPPAGAFTPKALDEDFLLFAGGSGITPVLSILKSALAAGSGRVVLVYANQHENAVIFADDLRRLAADHPERLHVIHWLESVQGLPSHAQLKALAAPYTAYTAFVCGPSPFMESVTHVLRELHVPPSRIHIERFQSLEEDPFAMAAPVAAEPGGATAALAIELDGARHTFDWPTQTKLLDFLLEKGLDAPFSCRQGACSACACILDSGEVKMIKNEILDQSDLDEGYVLACQALPITDSVSIRYS
ncbi:MAG TPA: ferredoxin--NADP reductase [Jatrophihabitantaceae bacterium]|jgi:3-ketosteroid 9alpha-monooxygenase subunit B|nr:ferredoxin--NADP reductase [Jatrophihabitantaceae bacterium]